jgi:hypothetical protein
MLLLRIVCVVVMTVMVGKVVLMAEQGPAGQGFSLEISLVFQ